MIVRKNRWKWVEQNNLRVSATKDGNRFFLVIFYVRWVKILIKMYRGRQRNHGMKNFFQVLYIHTYILSGN